MVLTPPTPPAAAPAESPPRFHRDRRERVVFLTALAIAAVLHLVLLLTVSFDIRTPGRPAARGPARVYRIDPQLQTYDIEIVAAPDVPLVLPPRPEPARLEAPPRAPLQAPLVPGPVTAEPAPAPAEPSAFERLSRGYGNPELYGDVGPLPLEELTERDLLRLRLEMLLGMYNDSLAVEAAARTRATDWTTRDASGNRWGISPGKIHLGKITLPLPFGFSAPPGRREEVAARVRSWYETQSQASRLEAEETFEARVKAMRSRQEAQRDSVRRQGGR